MLEFRLVVGTVVFALRRVVLAVAAQLRLVLVVLLLRHGPPRLQRRLRALVSAPLPGAELENILERIGLVAWHLSALLHQTNFVHPLGVVEERSVIGKERNASSPFIWSEPWGHRRPDRCGVNATPSNVRLWPGGVDGGLAAVVRWRRRGFRTTTRCCLTHHAGSRIERPHRAKRCVCTRRLSKRAVELVLEHVLRATGRPGQKATRERRTGNGARRPIHNKAGRLQERGQRRRTHRRRSEGGGGDQPQRLELRVPAPHVSGLSPRAIGDPTAKASRVVDTKLKELTLHHCTATFSNGCAQSKDLVQECRSQRNSGQTYCRQARVRNPRACPGKPRCHMPIRQPNDY